MIKTILIYILFIFSVSAAEGVDLVKELYQLPPILVMGKCNNKKNEIMESILSRSLFELVKKSDPLEDFRTGYRYTDYYGFKNVDCDSLGSTYKTPSWIDIYKDQENSNIVIVRPKKNAKYPEDRAPDAMLYTIYENFSLKFYLIKENGSLKIDNVKLFGTGELGDPIDDENDPELHDLRKRLSGYINRHGTN